MSDVVIKAENLGKKYIIGHNIEHGRYVALRDVLMNGARNLWQKTRDLVQSKPLIIGDETEEIWALKDVNLEVRRGEVVGIIGRNGAGKSTLLKVLSQITEPSEGRATIKGRVASLLEVGTGFHPELTGRENIYLNGAILGMSRAEVRRKFDKIVTFAEVEKFLDTPVKRYSSGMYLRLAFAVAAHLEPEILLVDEVLAVGDVGFQKKCLGKMGDVAKEGRTVLFVSHNMAAIKHLCQRALLLHSGRVVLQGLSDRVVDDYLGSFSTGSDSGLIPQEMHRSRSDKFRIWQVDIRNSQGHAVNEINMDETFEIVIRFEIREPTRGARLGVGISTLEGMRIATLHHTDCGAPPINAAPGLYQIVVQLVNFLLPGTYFLDLGAHETLGGLTLDHVPQARRFSVSEVSQRGEYSVPYSVNYNRGILRVEASWDDIRLADSEFLGLPEC